MPPRTAPALWEKLKPLARQMRHAPTPAEQMLWQRLRRRAILDYKFRRQHSIDRFIVDFVCLEAALIVEVDGEIHQYTAEEDAVRQEFLEALGFRVVRFRNDEVMGNLGAVMRRIREELTSPPAPSPLRGEGK